MTVYGQPTKGGQRIGRHPEPAAAPASHLSRPESMHRRCVQAKIATRHAEFSDHAVERRPMPTQTAARDDCPLCQAPGRNVPAPLD